MRRSAGGQAVSVFCLRVLQAGALVLLTILLARHGGAAILGVFTLLRSSIAVTYILLALGIPSSLVYFGAKEEFEAARFWNSVLSTSVSLGLSATLIFWVASLALRDRFFPTLSASSLGALSAAVLFTFVLQFYAAALRAHGRIFWSYVLSVLPDFGALVALPFLLGGVSAGGASEGFLVWIILVPSGIAAALAFAAGVRVACSVPRIQLDREIGRRYLSYGTKAYAGSLATFLNFRLDILILGAFATQAQVGVYAAASGLSEVLRMLSVSVAYAIKPRIVREPEEAARRRIRKYSVPLLVVGGLMAVSLMVAARPLLSLLYGAEFVSGAVLVWIITVGTWLSVPNGLFSSFLDARGRPELTSYAGFVGLGVTVLGAVLLVAPFGPLGAAITSAGSYAAVGAALVWFYRRHFGPAVSVRPVLQSAGAEP